jgi:hypothetical protein
MRTRAICNASVTSTVAPSQRFSFLAGHVRAARCWQASKPGWLRTTPAQMGHATPAQRKAGHGLGMKAATRARKQGRQPDFATGRLSGSEAVRHCENSPLCRCITVTQLAAVRVWVWPKMERGAAPGPTSKLGTNQTWPRGSGSGPCYFCFGDPSCSAAFLTASRSTAADGRSVEVFLGYAGTNRPAPSRTKSPPSWKRCSPGSGFSGRVPRQISFR